MDFERRSGCEGSEKMETQASEQNSLESVQRNNPSTSEVDEHGKWIKPITGKLAKLTDNPSSNLSIYKVPSKLRKLKENAYRPCIVSIGPFHHGESDLLAMEERKWRYMLSLLCRTSDPKKNLGECVIAISKLEKNACQYYAGHTINYYKEAEASLVEILLVDGCFILELLLRYSDKKFKDKDDPITNNVWMVPSIQRDLALLENQIPFIVILTLFATLKSKSKPNDPLASASSCSLPEIAMLFFQLVHNSQKPSISKELYEDDKHLLDMLHKVYLPNIPVICVSSAKYPEDNDAWGFRHYATKLSEAGIVFEKGTQGGLLDISFHEGVLVIPPFSIDETLDLRLRNLIAFEQCSFRTRHHISSYVLLMSRLIQSSNDIIFLQGKGIITKIPGTAEDASTFFSSMCNGVVFRDFDFTELCENVNVYANSRWDCHRIKALLLVKCSRYLFELFRDYFSNPWKAASVFAAVVLLVLTFLQTIYAMRS
ncbi:unnamed protein product [Ilex paraguariensis]|uniref:Uncharacterized protein n=1 Tax=Ilex paraguariensis TaxID=185542 RepID=A0ABC8TQH2_9AQUA